MSEVLAAVEDGPAESRVMSIAEAIGDVMHARVRSLSFAKGLNQDRRAELVLKDLDDPEVLLGILAANTSVRSACWSVVRLANKPIVLVPPEARMSRPAIGRVLVPLDGSPGSSAAVSGVVDLLASAGVDLVVLHVFDAATAPRFWDQMAYAPQAWAEEFLTRNVHASGARLELRSGSPGEQVVDVAAEENADLIAMGWSQTLEGERARTVRRSVLDSGIPVMLMPVA